MILDLCGGTGSWSKPYKDAGYDVRVIEIENSYDVRLYEWADEPVRGILAAPPCDHLSGSGARWWKEKGKEALLEALGIVDACLRAVVLYKPIWWALENPVGRLVHYLGPPTLYFHPCHYGDPWTKYTCLWGKFNIPAENKVEPTEGSKMHLIPPGPDRKRLRSTTPPGFAQAFFEANP